jgi:hypothetical protein
MRYEAHPDAAIFPMMSADELADLAADIKENGQKHPIVLGVHDGTEVIVDGRNRQEACEIADVEPKFTKMNGEDVKAFIISSNLKRRHLNSGQRAMALAMLYPTGRPGSKNSPTSSDSQEVWTVRAASLSHARAVLRDSRFLAEEVMSGVKFLDAAYKEAKARQDSNETADAKHSRLRAEAPELLPLVLESRMTLDDAIAALDERKRKAEAEEKNKREALIRNSETLYRGALAWAVPEFVDEVTERLADPEFRKAFAERVRVDLAAIDKIKIGAVYFHDILLKLQEYSHES